MMIVVLKNFQSRRICYLWCHTLSKNELIFSICLHPPFGCWYSRLFTAYLSCSLVSRRMHLATRYVSEWSPCTFINMLASNHIIELVNTGTSTCHSTLEKWTIGNKYQVLNRCQTRLHTGSGNRHMGFYSDKYGTCIHVYIPVAKATIHWKAGLEECIHRTQQSCTLFPLNCRLDLFLSIFVNWNFFPLFNVLCRYCTQCKLL